MQFTAHPFYLYTDDWSPKQALIHSLRFRLKVPRIEAIVTNGFSALTQTNYGYSNAQ